MLPRGTFIVVPVVIILIVLGIVAFAVIKADGSLYWSIRKMADPGEYERLESNHRLAVEKYREQFAIWEKAAERWEKTYYCERDNLVFIPGESPVPLDQMQKLIFGL